MWESLGFIIAFAYSNFLCTNAKLYVLTSALVVGMACYLVVEITEMKKAKMIKLTNKVSPEKEANGNDNAAMEMH